MYEKCSMLCTYEKNAQNKSIPKNILEESKGVKYKTKP